MKIRIEGQPGELEERVEDVIKTIRKISGQDDCDLEKAVLSKNKDQIPRKLDLVVLQGGVDRASKTVQRIRRKMVKDMLEVLREEE